MVRLYHMTAGWNRNSDCQTQRQTTIWLFLSLSLLIGYNVIEELVTSTTLKPPTEAGKHADLQCVVSSFHNVDETKADKLSIFIEF